MRHNWKNGIYAHQSKPQKNICKNPILQIDRFINLIFHVNSINHFLKYQSVCKVKKVSNLLLTSAYKHFLDILRNSNLNIFKYNKRN